MLSIPISKDYTWQLTAAGQPDMRKAQNRQNVCDMATRLHSELEQTKLVLKAKASPECPSECAICMEPMRGVTILQCGHSMCPGCFAQHSRVANACPFCRAEFAPPPDKQQDVPDRTQEIPLDRRTWLTNHYVQSHQFYLNNVELQVGQANSAFDRKRLLEKLVRVVGNDLLCWSRWNWQFP